MGPIVALIVAIIFVVTVVVPVVSHLVDYFTHRPSFNARVQPRFVCRNPKCVIEIRHRPRDILGTWTVSLVRDLDGPSEEIARGDSTESSASFHQVAEGIDTTSEDGEHTYRFVADDARFDGSDTWTVIFEGTRVVFVGTRPIIRRHRFEFLPDPSIISIPQVSEQFEGEGSGQPFVEAERGFFTTTTVSIPKGEQTISLCPETTLRSITIESVEIDSSQADSLVKIPGGRWADEIDNERTHPAEVHMWGQIGETAEQYFGVFREGESHVFDPLVELDTGILLRARMESGPEGDFQEGFAVAWAWSAQLNCSES